MHVSSCSCTGMPVAWPAGRRPPITHRPRCRGAASVPPWPCKAGPPSRTFCCDFEGSLCETEMVAGAHARRESRRVLGRTSSTPARFSACRIETLLASSTRRTVVWEDDEASWPFGAAHTVTMAAGSSWKTPTAAMIRGRPLAASEHSKRLSCLPGRWCHQQGHDLWRSGRREDAFRSEMPNCVPLMNHVSDQEK